MFPDVHVSKFDCVTRVTAHEITVCEARNAEGERARSPHTRRGILFWHDVRIPRFQSRLRKLPPTV